MPLEIDETPDDNIIIIEAGEPFSRATYKVMYYLDGVLKETEVYEDDIGAVISVACQKDYDGVCKYRGGIAAYELDKW